MKRTIAAIALATASGIANAEGVAGGLNAGTLGFGAQLAFALREDINLRIGANGGSFSYDFDQDGVEYEGKVKLGNVPLIVDWFPTKGIFRLSAGIAANSSKFNAEGRPQSGVFVIGNNTYSAPEIGSVTGEAKYDAVAPYIGVGWGNAVQRGKNFGWNLDLGLLYQGTPKTTYTVTCGPAIVGTAICTQLQNDAAIEAAQFDDEVKKYKWYPVAQFWLSWQF